MNLATHQRILLVSADHDRDPELVNIQRLRDHGIPNPNRYINNSAFLPKAQGTS